METTFDEDLFESSQDNLIPCNQEASKQYYRKNSDLNIAESELFVDSEAPVETNYEAKGPFTFNSRCRTAESSELFKRKKSDDISTVENNEHKKTKIENEQKVDPFAAFNETYDHMFDCFEKNAQNVAIRSLDEELEKSQFLKDVQKTFDDLESTLCYGKDYMNNTKLFVEGMKEEDFELFQSSADVLENHRTPIKNHECKGPFFGLPEAVKELIKQYKGIDSLYDWQHECLTLPAITKRSNLIYALPTSGGKTLVAEILMLREIICRQKNVLFILPFVSIVQEKVWALSPFAVNLGFLIEEYAAGKGMLPPRKRRKKNTIYIATIEKALGIVRSLMELNRLNEIGLIIVDELHLVGEPNRGNVLEILLTNILYLKEDIQIVGMSATIGNLDEIAKFLNATIFCKDFRPVELKEFVKIGSDILHIDWKNSDVEERISFDHKVNYEYSSQIEKIDPDHLGGLVMEVIPKGSCLIFCPTKKSCENVAVMLCKVIFKDLLNYRKEEKLVLKKALKDEGVTDKTFFALIDWGVAYHHSGLGSEERKLIEDAFRSGVLSLLCCTSTLAAGVNLPAQRVILRAPMIGREFIPLSTYKQMVGRAGRAGFGGHGDSILICSSSQFDRVKALIASTMNTADSSLHHNDGAALSSLVLSSIALDITNTRKTLRKLLDCSLLSVQAKRFGIKPYQLLDAVITHLLKTGALQVDQSDNEIEINTSVLYAEQPSRQVVLSRETKLAVSKLGKAAIKGCIELSRAQKLYSDLTIAQRSLVLMGPLHLLYIVVPYDAVDSVRPNLPTYYSLLSSQNDEILQTAKVIGFTEAHTVQIAKGKTPANIPLCVFNRFYIALMLNDLWNQENLQDVSDKFIVNRGTIQTLMISTATFASCCLKFCEEMPEFWAFKDLLLPFSQRLSHCCISELVPLMELPSVKKSRALQLYKAGFKTLQAIARATSEELMNSIEYMSKTLANQLISAAKLLLLEKVENLRDEAEDVMEGLKVQD